MKKEQLTQLIEKLQIDKRFIKYNNGKEIKSIIVRFLDNKIINYIINNKILVRFDITTGNVNNHYNYLSIQKPTKSWIEKCARAIQYEEFEF